MDSYAEPLDLTWPSLGCALLLVETTPKYKSSREAMQMPMAYQDAWVQKTERDIQSIVPYIINQDFDAFGALVESNALAMHGAMLSALPPVLYWQPQTVASGVTVLSQTIEYTTQDLYDGSVGPGVQTAGGIWSAVVDLFHNKTSTTIAEALVFQDAGFDAAGVVARAVMAVEPMFAYYDANSNSALCVGMNVSVLVDSAGKMRLGASSADGVVTGAASITGFSPGHFTLGFDLLFPRRKVSFANPLYNAGGRYTGTLVVGGNMQSCTPPVVQPDTNAAACASMIYQGTNLSYPPFPIPPAPGPVALPIVEPTDNPIDAGGLLLP